MAKMPVEYDGGIVVDSVADTSHPTIATQAQKDITLTATKSGYTPLAIAGTNISSSGAVVVAFVNVTGSTIFVRLLNTGSASQTIGNVTITVLYKKNN